MNRKLFCEINSFTYALSRRKEILIKNAKDFMGNDMFAQIRQTATLPVVVYRHRSLIRRKLGDVDITLQENKAVNLSLTAPKLDGVLIKPDETFSFWKLVGNCTERKGYKEGLTISKNQPSKGIGGGLCQFTNLLHWLVLHSPLDITEHHHHDGFDLFPDFGRQVPFGCGTSILYNYLDYRFQNNTDHTFQIVVYTTETHLCGELRANKPIVNSYHILEDERHFICVEGEYYRLGNIYKSIVDKHSGIELNRELLKKNYAKVMYSAEYIDKSLLRDATIKK